MVFSNKVYDKLKFLAQIVLPALGTLYATVSGLMKWPNTEEVVGTIMAVDFFLGTILGLSTNKAERSGQLYDGTIKVDSAPEQNNVNVDFHKEFEEYNDQKEVRLKVLPS